MKNCPFPKMKELKKYIELLLKKNWITFICAVCKVTIWQNFRYEFPVYREQITGSVNTSTEIFKFRFLSNRIVIEFYSTLMLHLLELWCALITFSYMTSSKCPSPGLTQT